MNYKLLLLTYVAFFIISCDDESCYRPRNCYNTEPDEADLVINLSINNENPSVDITVYKGDYEENEVVTTFSTSKTTEVLSLPEGRYSATALYNSGSKQILAVDGDRISITHWTCDDSSGYVSDECYEVEHGEIDLTL